MITNLWDEHHRPTDWYDVTLPSVMRRRMEALGRGIPRIETMDPRSKLGQGSYGQVFHMSHSGRDVAVKVFTGCTVDRMEISHLRDFIMSKVCGSLPHCVPLQDHAVLPHNREPALIMPLFQTDLHQLLRRQALDCSQRHSLMKDLLTALQAMHDKGYMHRDVKPSNCLLSKEHRLFLGDFNLTRTISQDATYTVTGAYEPLSPVTQTFVYRAPEVCLGAKRYTQAIDLFSVGLIWLEMLKHSLVINEAMDPEDTWGALYHMLRIFGAPNADALRALRRTGIKAARLNELTRHAIHLEKTCGYPMGRDLHAMLRRVCCVSEAQVICGLLDWNPETRWTAAQALVSPYFIPTVANLQSSSWPTLPPLTTHPASKTSAPNSALACDASGTSSGAQARVPAREPARAPVPQARKVILVRAGAANHSRPLHPWLQAEPNRSLVTCAEHGRPLRDWKVYPLVALGLVPIPVPAPPSRSLVRRTAFEPIPATHAAPGVAMDSEEDEHDPEHELGGDVSPPHDPLPPTPPRAAVNGTTAVAMEL